MPHSYSKNLQTNLLLDKAKITAEEALVMAGFINTRWLSDQNIFKAECATSIWSWGETIIISFEETTTGTLVCCNSSCRLATQFIDWGKNKKNVRKFFNSLKELL